MKLLRISLIEIRKETNLWFNLILLLMLSLIFLRTVFSIPIPVFIFLIMSLSIAIFGTPSQILAFGICCIPLSAAFQYKYALLLFIVFYILRTHWRLRINGVSVAIIILMIWELLHGFYGQFSFVEYFRGFAELLFLLILMSVDMKKINYKLILRSLVFCTVGVCLTVFILQMKNVGWNLSFIGTGFRFGSGNEDALNYGLSFNPNKLGFICNLSLTGLMILYSRKEHNRFDIVPAVLLMLFGFLTLSRTYVVCLAVVVLGFMLTISGNLKKKIINILIILSIVIVTWIILIKFFPEIYTGLLSRFQERNVTNGRNVLLKFYNDHIFSSFMYFFFGIGLQDYVGKIRDIYGGVVNACHNGYQEIWTVWGIVGMVIFIYITLVLLKIARNHATKQKVVQYIPLVLLLVSIFAGQFVSSGHTLLSLSFIFVCLCIRDNSVYCDDNL